MKTAKYTITIEREIGTDDGQENLGVTDEKSAIQQLRGELQEAFDAGIIAGSFNIESRIEE